ncbi:adenylate cyclase [Kaistia adipata]|uniref:adenylate cyclase n=1 Tax=Kaistia adipata TaxID=166954 RepID=UPI000412115E|nr:adenylate cyclase [Kaistia adipata]
MKQFIAPTILGVSLLATSAGLALAANVHTTTGTTGQPNQTIGSAQTGSVTPGQSASAPGSAFNPDGTAGTHYAGTQPQNSNNPKSVSQYDVAGFQQSHKPNP